MLNTHTSRLRFGAVALTVLLAACSNDSNNSSAPVTPTPPPEPTPVNFSYDVTVTNLTNAQPLSPIAVILHREGNLWTLGESASTALEEMSESGDNSSLRTLALVMAQTSGDAPLVPGASETLSITIADVSDSQLSLATMLVNTNDAFTGLDARDLSNMEVGDTWSVNAAAYDAGTEANSEAAGTIPGPADGSDGSGFNAERDDVDFVGRHQGVVTSDDGLSTSVLNAEHTFDNPVLRLSVTRTE